ncbi:MAG TPA: hypothetical protein VFQ35_26080, partial [Polyangiaceae bacterium]|nr:hypothetical protein [Polyangiaceae bacterium]
MGNRFGKAYLRLSLLGLSLAGCTVSTASSDEATDSDAWADAGTVVTNDQTSARQAGEGSESLDRVLDPHERSRMSDWLAQNRIANAIVQKRLHTSDGHKVDCVAIRDQPSMRGGSMTRVATPPKLATESDAPVNYAPSVSTLFDANDAASGCDAGTVPILEVSQQTLTRFRTLEDFFQKVPSHLSG